MKREAELTSKQLERLDELDNAAHEYLKVLLSNPDLEWNMEYIGELNETMAAFMCSRGHRIHYPSIDTDENGNETNVDYYEPTVSRYVSYVFEGNKETKHRNVTGYWDTKKFGDPDECDGVLPEGFAAYRATITTTESGVITVFARSREEAMEIADGIGDGEDNINVADHVNVTVKLESDEKEVQ